MTPGPSTEHPYTSLPAGKVPCVRCAAVVDASKADYDVKGELVCTRCAGVNDIEATEVRAVVRMKATAYGNLGVGAASWLINPYFLATALAIANASYVAKSLTGDWYPRRMDNKTILPLVAGVLGGILSVLPFIFAIFTS